MTPERWERIVALFEGALERPADERADFLRDQCGEDAALRRDVEAMLAGDTRASLLFGDPPDELARALNAPPPNFEGLRVGAYRILHEIGRGGMGTVYLAERDDVGLRAALKLVRGGLAAPERVQRFLLERRVLARLDHPHVARLLDAGITDDGTPWYAMELVDGEPIDHYCDRNRLTVDQRLTLFEKVCHAVAAAHASLVVHRDLKPGNIMVDRDGEPKLLDFGIAKLLGDDTDDAFTRTGVNILTPRYAAPEQLTGKPVTTASDVYSLGAVLYLLLGGRHARPGIGDHALTADTVRPSVAATTAAPHRAGAAAPGTTPEEIAAARATDPARLRRRLAGELDAIVLKALAPEPDRRYSSAELLCADLRNHREGRPVTARPDSVAYRARKFILRNRVGVGIAALLVFMLSGFAAAMTFEQRVTARERDRAENEAEKASRTAAFLKDLLRAADPTTAGGEQISAQQLLDLGFARVQSEFSDHSDVQADLLDLMADIYVELGRYAEATRAAERSVALRRMTLDPADPALIPSLNQLWSTMDYTGRRREALASIDSVLPLLRSAAESRAELLGEVLGMRGRMHYRIGAFPEARADYAESLTLLRRAIGSDAPITRTTMNNYGVLLLETGDYAEARRVHHENYTFRLARSGELNTQTLTSMLNHARALHALGEWAEAEPLLRRALELRTQALSPDHPSVATAQRYLAQLLIDRAQYEEADTLLNTALQIYRRRAARDSVSVALTLMELGRVHTARGEITGAARLLDEALRLAESALHEDHPTIAEILVACAENHLRAGARQRAQDLLQRARGIQQTQLGPQHPELARTLHALALAVQPDSSSAAAALLHRAYEIRRQRLGLDHPYTRGTSQALRGLQADLEGEV